MRRFCFACLSMSFVLFSTSLPVSAATTVLEVTVTAGGHDRENAPVRVPVAIAAEPNSGQRSVSVMGADGKSVPGQLAVSRLLSATKPDQPVTSELCFIPSAMKSGETQVFKVTISDEAPAAGPAFKWDDVAGKSTDLSLAGRPVLRYMYESLDKSSKERRDETFKPYHHVFDPAGKRLVTKGPGGLFQHHRGLYFGFNKITYGENKKADTWHCNNGEYQSHEKLLASATGPVFGRHLAEIGWRGQDGEVFAREQRELTAYNVSGGLLIEFASRLTSTVGKVQLKGDPQHAGFQFRASQDVPDKTAKQTYYVRPDGKDKPGSFRNWSDKPTETDVNKRHVNLPWNAVSFVLDDQRFTCCYLDRPENPKESRFSERDYARFGSYFEYELDEGKPLDLNYRIWLQAGEMSVEQIQSVANNFVAPPQATAKQ